MRSWLLKGLILLKLLITNQMTKKTKAGIRFFFFLVSLGAIGFTAKAKTALHPVKAGKNFNDSTDNSFKHINTRYKAALDRLKLQAEALKPYLLANNYNADYCFLVDMSIPSGKKRFFIYNLKTEEVIQSSLVSHGLGSRINGSDEDLQFSNDPSSLQTSLGKYKVGASYNGNFGLSYKLYGLDNTNSRAFERSIVIHAHSSIPTTETYPMPIGQSFGCPSVAPEFLNTLTRYIKGSQKPVLMWIYN